MVLLLAPIVPHITEHIWQTLGNQGLLIDAAWPRADDSALAKSEIQLIVQVNGKLRARLSVGVDELEDDIKALALADENVSRFVADKTIKKIIVVPGRLVNIVVA